MATIGRDLHRAKELLVQGDVVGIPTETVYGLAGNALDETSILKIYEVKNRPKFDPLIAHVDSLEKVSTLVKDVPEQAERLAAQFWPGPLTLLLEKASHIPDLLTSGHRRVAVRIPDHELTHALLSQVDFPLAAPSANPFGYVSPTSASHVNDQLGDKISYILDGGNSKVGLESTIIGFEDGKTIVYRLGGISLENVESCIGKVYVEVNSSSDPSAPGMLKSHYSPGTKISIGNIAECVKGKDISSVGIISFCENYDLPSENLFVLSPTGDLNEAARNIFKALRKMDQPHIKEVFAEWVPDQGLGRAINDRLKRAAV